MAPLTQHKIRIGTRASALARWQAEWVAAQLAARGVATEFVHITTSGDTEQQGPIGNLGTTGVFTKEIQNALLDNRVDLAVHSLKDLPTNEVPGLVLAAVPEREAVDDVLLSRDGKVFLELPTGARIGTGSLRRVTQLRSRRDDLAYVDIRGNVDTRLRKMQAGEYDAIVLALAGVRRLGLESHVSEVLPRDLILPAVGQGALGLETRADDLTTQTVMQTLNDPASHAAVLAERSLLATLRGGCMAPIGAWARVNDAQKLQLSACVLSIDGQARIAIEMSEEIQFQSVADAEDENETWQQTAIYLGKRVALQMIEAGAERLIASARQ